jgi:hypothetical protein
MGQEGITRLQLIHQQVQSRKLQQLAYRRCPLVFLYSMECRFRPCPSWALMPVRGSLWNHGCVV